MSMLIAPSIFSASGGAPPIYAPYTSALLHFDEADGTTSFTDAVGNIWTGGSTAKVSSTSPKFGSGCGVFSGGSFTTPSSANFGFGADDFTVAGWLYIGGPNLPGNQCLFDNRSASNQGCAIYASINGNGILSYYNNSAQLAASTGGWSQTDYTHWAITRQMVAGVGTVRGFLGGVKQFEITDSRTLAAAALPIIGNSYVNSQPFTGRLDDILILKGMALYTADFTPPTSPYQDP